MGPLWELASINIGEQPYQYQWLHAASGVMHSLDM